MNVYPRLGQVSREEGEGKSPRTGRNPRLPTQEAVERGPGTP